MSLSSSIARGAPKALAFLTLQAFALALFTSASLMFAVQPMFTRMVLPVLGGSPGVWSVAMVFFQGTLLLGYLYAHLITRWLPMRAAALAHLVLLCVAFISLPIAIAQGWDRPPGDDAAFWLIGLFAVSVGLPFFALAGNGPLLQAWFARSGHRDAADPYFLYGASNLGSFCGLLLYPLAFEPLLTLSQQSRGWSFGFVVLIGLIACASALALRLGGHGASASSVDAAPLSWRQQLAIVGYAFVPSGLLVAVTAQMSTDVAAAPFLWVMPLALFLLTFYLAFRERPLIPHHWMLRAQPWLIALAVLLVAAGNFFDMLLAIAIMLVTFLVCAMVAHGELYRRRPEAGQLTEFYLWMSVGGVCGGIFCALIAPRVFTGVIEYPLLLTGALLCRPAFAQLRWRDWGLEAGALALLALALTMAVQWGVVTIDPSFGLARLLVAVILCGAIALSGGHPGRLIGLTAATLTLMIGIQPGAGRVYAARSFFGVHRVVDSQDGRLRLLYHGTTIHGGQRLLEEDGGPAVGRPEMLTYYYSGGPFSQAIMAARMARGGAMADVAVVGLGSGTLACAREPGENWRFFEIDPEVIRIARNAKLFHFLDQCAPNAEIVEGDARLTLGPDPHLYDVIILDAFSSDAIPVHLLTKEAIATYFSKLKRGGTIIMNITNRHMELAEVVTRVAGDLGLDVVVGHDPAPVDFWRNFHARATIAVVARARKDFGGLEERPDWRLGVPSSEVRAWTDDYSNLVQAIWRKLRG